MQFINIYSHSLFDVFSIVSDLPHFSFFFS
jgi:hypothetical protein